MMVVVVISMVNTPIPKNTRYSSDKLSHMNKMSAGWRRKSERGFEPKRHRKREHEVEAHRSKTKRRRAGKGEALSKGNRVTDFRELFVKFIVVMRFHRRTKIINRISDRVEITHGPERNKSLDENA
ncbi:unnamed protein product [Brassica rapa]|uniref:Uncharacterized protein n=1 Tax=Brassica campestris TaxID=3711 RepID=A0A8D9DMX0_BRACM|nr:unnamed protein product [Brassica rapa]